MTEYDNASSIGADTSDAAYNEDHLKVRAHSDPVTCYPARVQIAEHLLKVVKGQRNT